MKARTTKVKKKNEDITREQLIEFAAFAGLSIEFLFSLTFRELHHYAIGYNRREAARVAPFRILAYITYCANLGPKKRPVPITQFWPLWGDPEPEIIDAQTEREKIAKLKRIWQQRS